MVSTITKTESEVSEEVDSGAPPMEDAVVESSLTRSKFDRERWRRIAASAAIFCFVVLSAAALVPESATSAKVDQSFGSPIRWTGMNQNWGVFSPEPLQTEIRVVAVVYFDDGSSSDWAPPTDRVFDSSRSERWRKWEGRVRQDDYVDLWPVAAEFVANEFADDARAVARVRLIRTWTQVPLPPEPNSDRKVEEFQFYEWDHLTSTGTKLTQADQLLVEYSS